jgi:hypothetical protein
MRARGPGALAVLGVAAMLATAVLTAGGAAPAARAATSRDWVPPTPAYWPQVVGEQATRPVTVTHGVREYTPRSWTSI